jgi:hypothetical protein
MKRIKLNLSIALLAIAATIAVGFKYPVMPTDSRLDYITAMFQKYIQKYHQNKVYVQTDKNEYDTGETIFFKAYVLNSAKNKPESLVKNLYVDMIAPDKSVFMTRLLKIENGIALGDFPVLDTVQTGLYMLQAYTQNMKNSGDDYFFKKEIRVNHPKSLYYSREYHKKAKKIKRKAPETDLQFFPEGGDLVHNIKSTLAFKAIDQQGNGIALSGKIFGSNNIAVADFKTEHQGMGKIEMTPVYGQKYYAVFETANGKKQRVKLPEVIQVGYVLNVDDMDSQFRLTIRTNKTFGADPVAKTVYLVAQSGGKIYSSGMHVFEKERIELNIGKKIFPTGVVHFTLFDGQGNAQCERIAFANNGDWLHVQASQKQKQIKPKGKVELDISVSDIENMPVVADLAISVRQKKDFGKSDADIRAYLLLQADVSGKIENPSYYFSQDKNAGYNLDLLMLTQGWRKFLWKDILGDSIKEPQFPVEKDLRITGKITKYFFDIPVKDALITLTLLNQFNDIFKTRSGKKGHYEFTGLDYRDTIDVLMEVRTASNRKNVLIHIDESVPTGNTFSPFKGFYLDSLQKRHKIPYKKYVPEPEDPSRPKDHKIHSEADQVIKFNDQLRNSGQSVMDILRSKVPGLRVGQNESSLRGPSSLYLSSDPLYLIDGVPSDFSGVQALNVYDVDYVEILKGPSTAIYGMRGHGGVIAIYTIKGRFYKRGEIRFKMLGYHTPRKFYAPKYGNDSDVSDIPDQRKTIFWNPRVVTGSNGNARIEFFHSDLTGTFEIVIEGISPNGVPGSFVSEYVVQ